MEPRRRVIVGDALPTLHPNSEAAQRLQAEELDLDPEILQIWEEFENEEMEPLDRHRELNRKPVVTTNMIWFLLMTFVGMLLFFANYFSTKEMHRLKTETLPNAPHEAHVGQWWHSALIYHIVPRSFKDSNDDGIGDINGIRSKLSHLSYLRADAVLLSSVLKSANVDVAKDPTDFYDIDPSIGTMKDFESLLQELHDKEIKVVLEIIPNHTSDLHPWFQSSRTKGTSPHAEWYIWHEGKILEDGSRGPPSNWMSRYGGSGWTWDDTRKAYYFHQYSKHTPDLNHTNMEVRKQMLDILDFWIGKGVDGILFDDVHTIFEHEDVTIDEPVNELIENPIPGTYEYLEHVYTDDQPEMHEYLAYWREHFDTSMGKVEKKIYLGCRAVDDMNADILKYYMTGVDAPLCPALTHVTESSDAFSVHQLIDDWLIELPDGKSTLWQLSDSAPEIGRVATRKGRQYAGAMATIQLLLPGSSLVYYGDEIGMEDTPLTLEQMQDIRVKTMGQAAVGKTSDQTRTPMQWTGDDPNAGFTGHGKTWLPVHPNYATINVKAEYDAPQDGSLLKLYRHLVKLRSTPSFVNGFFKLSYTNHHIISFLRFKHDENPYYIIVNVGTESYSGDISITVGSDQGSVVMYYCPPELKPQPHLEEGKTVELAKLQFRPGEVFVLMLF